MAAAAVLPFPADRSKNISDLQSQLVEAGVEAVRTVAGTLMDKFKGKDFQAISELLLEQGQQVTGAMFTKLLNAVATDSATTAFCPQCKAMCSVHSTTGRTVDSLHGELDIKRPYFYCSACCYGFAPFDAKMKLAPQKKQYDLQAGAAELLAEVPYDMAARLFKRLTGKPISDHALHELGSRLGETARKEDVLPSRKLVDFPFGACLMASMMRFSVGPFTAQLLNIITSASTSEVASWKSACFRQPAKTSPSAMFAEQPKLLRKTCNNHVHQHVRYFNKG